MNRKRHKTQTGRDTNRSGNLPRLLVYLPWVWFIRISCSSSSSSSSTERDKGGGEVGRMRDKEGEDETNKKTES